MAEHHFILIALIFLLAGLVKGVIGMGLPTISMGLLALVMPPAEAAALLIVPSLVTNVWQMVVGPHLRPLVRRLWPMMLTVVLGTWAAAWLGFGLGAAVGPATIALGVALALYALVGLLSFRLRPPGSGERLWSPLIGAITGAITAATGVFVIPAVPYLQALGLEKDALVQALGLSFTVSTIALAVGLSGGGSFGGGVALHSLLALAPAVLGMAIGQALLRRVSPATFRLCFFAGLLLLGLHLAAGRLL
ncbi:MAG: sulfite exporter TauE/SafE family protein [Rhodospirillales bacterium]|nr:sulfite exporter TauE/SafE family protein [Rhodospirillales bacterium]